MSYEINGPILPMFESVGDHARAQALSEAMLAGQCMFLLGDTYPHDPGNPDISFPPEPTHIIFGNAAYLNDAGAIAMGVAIMDDPISKSQALKLYRGTVVDKFQKAAPHAARVLGCAPDVDVSTQLGETVTSLVRSSESRLVAAHIIGRSPAPEGWSTLWLFPTHSYKG